MQRRTHWTLCLFSPAVALALVIITAYYILGPHRFPDYSNYITIVEKGGFLFNEHEYFAEWLSRWWLIHGDAYVGTPARAVDVLAGFAQALFLSYLVLLQRNRAILRQGAFFFCAILGPLLLTTAIRSTPAYICVTAIILSERQQVLKLLLLSLLAIGFHDSAGPLIAIAVFSIALAKAFPKLVSRMNFAIVLTAVGLVLLGPKINVLIINFVRGFDIGIRSIYLEITPEPSRTKMIYGLFVATHSYLLASRKDIRLVVRTFVAVACCASALVFVLNETASIRTFLFPLCVAVTARNSFLFIRPHGRLLGLMDWAAGLFFCLLSFYDLVRERAAP